ncbi:class I SAM-dependent methyltransferase [Stella sp.]|uniref:class I SAM-dependent methyltransferase n=1 Tax=Stella sp. TaxID=2912054 RepID=UPI0035AF4CDE
MTADTAFALPADWSAPLAWDLSGLPRALRLMLALARRIRRGRLVIVVPDGRRYTAEGPEPGRTAVLLVRHPRLARRLLVGGATGFAESYVDGDWDSPDPAELMTLALENEAAIGSTLDGSRWYRAAGRILHALRRNSRTGSRRNIRRHYDLGNRFYAAWLDPGMTYSSAVFATPGQDLAAAQEEKFRRLAALLDLRPGMRVLEIGCGWGALARHLAAEHGCRVTAVTISPAQHAHAVAAAQAAGLADRVDTRLTDYRDVGGTFDRIVSVEMIEAVGERYWPVFFGRLADRLAPHGAAVLQAITIDERFFDTYRRSADFIQRHVFPGGMLPSRTVIRQQAARAGLAVAADHGYGPHYARTLELWKARFGAAWPEIAGMGFDARFRRLWDMYLDYCRAGFTAGTIDVRHVRLARA